MLEFIDSLYGSIRFPRYVTNLIIKNPELLRLTKIRMSNIDNIAFPAFSSISRFEHIVGVAFLADEISKHLELDKTQRIEFIISGLYHDIHYPPFSHFFETLPSNIIFEQFNHEYQGEQLIKGITSKFYKTDSYPVYGGKQFSLINEVNRINKSSNLDISLDNIVQNIAGEGYFGVLFNSDIDLDNIDNVCRCAHRLSILNDTSLPLKLIKSYIIKDGEILFDWNQSKLIREWLGIRYKLYSILMNNKFDLNREAMLKFIIKKAFDLNYIDLTHWIFTEDELLLYLENKFKNNKHLNVVGVINNLRIGNIFNEIQMIWITDETFVKNIKSDLSIISSIEEELSDLLSVEIIIHIMFDKRLKEISKLKYYNSDEEEIITHKFGTQYQNVLMGIYSSKNYIYKHDKNTSKAILDSNKKKLIMTDSDICHTINYVLRKYLNSFHIFTEQSLGEYEGL